LNNAITPETRFRFCENPIRFPRLMKSFPLIPALVLGVFPLVCRADETDEADKERIRELERKMAELQGEKAKLTGEPTADALFDKEGRVNPRISNSVLIIEGDAPLQINTEIAALGNGGGNGVVAVEKGKILGTSGDSLEVDAGVIQGTSGGPVVELATSKAVRSRDGFKPQNFAWFHRSRAVVSVQARKECLEALDQRLGNLK